MEIGAYIEELIYWGHFSSSWLYSFLLFTPCPLLNKPLCSTNPSAMLFCLIRDPDTIEPANNGWLLLNKKPKFHVFLLFGHSEK
jgi:hypothetical protein